MVIILGILCIGIGIYLIFFGRRKASAELLEIQFQQTKTIAEAKEAVEAMADVDLNYREMVELKGFSACDNPPTTPFSRKQVAYYVAETYKVSEETFREKDSDGNERMRTVKHEDKLSEEESGENLILKDNNGDSVIIETNGVSDKLDLQKTLDRFQNESQYRNDFYMNPHRRFREFNVNGGAGYRLLGYKQVEKTFPLNAAMYALGEVYMNCGQLYLGPPRDSSKPFIVTTKSEEELVKSKKNAAMMNLALGIFGVVIGAVFIIMGIVK